MMVVAKWKEVEVFVLCWREESHCIINVVAAVTFQTRREVCHIARAELIEQ